MKKMIYIARRHALRGGDSYELGTPSFDIEDARYAIIMETAHLTSTELLNNDFDIIGYLVETGGGTDANALYTEWFDAAMEENCWIPDPDYYEEVTA